jgi:hypothetical protein
LQGKRKEEERKKEKERTKNSRPIKPLPTLGTLVRPLIIIYRQTNMSKGEQKGNTLKKTCLRDLRCRLR